MFRKTDIDDRLRTIYQADMAVDQEMLEFRLIGNGFLYNMVRIIVGTILEVGQGKRSADSISTILEAKDRRYAGPTAPPQGLYLWKVYYDN